MAWYASFSQEYDITWQLYTIIHLSSWHASGYPHTTGHFVCEYSSAAVECELHQSISESIKTLKNAEWQGTSQKQRYPLVHCNGSCYPNGIVVTKTISKINF